MKKKLLLLLVLLPILLFSQKPRVIVSTDIGGSDPDDFQSMVHFLVYADIFDIEGLISSPPGEGRKHHIEEALAAYKNDYDKLKTHGNYPSYNYLMSVTKQGATNPQSSSTPPSNISSGAQHIIDRAKANDSRPLYILVWGSITDVAQAVHKDPSIKNKIRVYFIGSWNTRQDPKSRDYLYNNHSDMWWIECNTTFRGMYKGGYQDGDYGNKSFVSTHVKGHGSLGNLFYNKKTDIKMGDTPSVLYLIWNKNVSDPTTESWGGMFRSTNHGGNYWTDRTDYEVSGYDGAGTVCKWRKDYLDDWKARMDRCNSVGGDYLSASPSELNFSSAAGSSDINISSNISWNVSESLSWVSLSKTSGSNNGTVGVSVTENSQDSPRSGIIKISASGEDDVLITVNQAEWKDVVNFSNITQGYKQMTLTTGVEYYSDRSFTTTAVPAGLEGQNFIQTANDDKNGTGSNFLCFDLDKNAELYVAYDSRATSLPGWLSTWTPVPDKIEVTDGMQYFNLYKKAFNAGTVCLGGNADSPANGYGSMYLVAGVSNGVSIPVTGVSVSPTIKTLEAGQSVQLTATISPSDATDQSVSWTSSNSSVATVSNAGLVTAISGGTASITVTTNDGGFTANSTITVIVPVTGVSVSPAAQTIAVGETMQLAATVSPSGASDASVAWSSSNEAVATVSSNGQVSGLAEGTAIITVTTNDGGFSATSEISVGIPVTGISVSPLSQTLDAGQTVQLTATVSPSDATDQSVSWTSSDNDIATVSSTGLVTAVSGGTATITATTNDGGFTATSEITVHEPVTGVSVSPTAQAINVGTTFQLTATVSPAGASDPSVTWSSSEGSVATVSNTGLVTAHSTGIATISVVTNDGGFSATSEISVIKVVDLVFSNIGQGYEQSVLAEGVEYYKDRNYTVTNLPSYLDGKNFIRTENDDKSNSSSSFLCFTINADADLYVAYDNRASSLPGWLGDWELVAEQVAVTDGGMGYFNLYKKTFAQGEICLGGNNQSPASGAGSMYIVTGLVSGEIVPVTGVNVSPTAQTLEAGQTLQLTATVSPVDAFDPGVTWSSTNDAVAFVNTSGVVTAQSAGEATIKVTTNDGGYTATSVITVFVPEVPVTGVSVSPASTTLAIGAGEQLTATVSPADATDQSVTWSSSDPAIATVSSTGLVTAVAIGESTITVTTNDGGFTATSDITVTDGIIPDLIFSNIGQGYSQSVLQVGEKYYSDRQYTVEGLPAYLDGNNYIQTANDDKGSTSSSYLCFTINADADIYVAYDNRASSLPAWLSDWKLVGDRLTVTDGMEYFDLYKKSFAKGNVCLGGNNQSPASGAGSMYIVTGIATGTVIPPDNELPWSDPFDNLSNWNVTSGEVTISGGRGMINQSTATMVSNVIDISGASNVTISLEAEGVDATVMEAWDTFVASYRVDGGNWVTFVDKDDGFAKQTFSVANLSGSTLEIQLEIKNTGADEFHFVDNVNVYSDMKKSALAIGETSDDQVLGVYPNPAVNGYVTISNLPSTTCKVMISDLTGKIMYNQEVYGAVRHQVSTGDFAKGLYIISVLSERKQQTAKLLVE